MNIHFCSYADERMTKAQAQSAQWAAKMGVNGAILKYNFEHLAPGFIEHNIETLACERGAGYWIWKPFVIDAAMKTVCEDGDILIYMDAGCELVAPVQHIIQVMDEDIFFFSNGHKHVEWCKGDALALINRWYADSGGDMLQAKQVQASVIFFKVTPKSRQFVKTWLELVQIPGLIDDSPSNEPNFKTFAEHRHDQAILTCLQIRDGYKLHWWPTQYSEHIRDGYANDRYPVMFNHHRKRNNQYA